MRVAVLVCGTYKTYTLYLGTFRNEKKSISLGHGDSTPSIYGNSMLRLTNFPPSIHYFLTVVMSCPCKQCAPPIISFPDVRE